LFPADVDFPQYEQAFIRGRKTTEARVMAAARSVMGNFAPAPGCSHAIEIPLISYV
jgi:hypothetical protein